MTSISRTPSTARLLALAVFLTFHAQVLLSQVYDLEFKDIEAMPAVSLPADGAFGPWVGCEKVERRARILKTDLIIGEPVIIEFQMVGRNEYIKSQFEAPFMLEKDVDIWIQPPKGQPYKYDPGPQGGFGMGSTWQLGNGETAEAYEVLGFDPETVQGAMFDLAGKYSILIQHLCLKSSVMDNLGTFEINVRLGDDNPQNSFARNELAYNHENFKSIHFQTVIDSEHTVPLEKIYRDAPDSALWPWATFSLADYKMLSGNPAQVQESIDMYREIIENYDGHYLQYSSLVKVTRGLRELGREKEAQIEFLKARQNPIIATRISKGDVDGLSIFGEPKDWTPEAWYLWENVSDGYFDPLKRAEELNRRIIKAELHREKKIEILLWDDLKNEILQ